MKCPLNRGRYEFEGGDDCRADCAAIVNLVTAKVCPANAIAVALLVATGIVKKEDVRLSTVEEE